MTPLTSWPQPERGPQAVREIINDASREEAALGLDVEFNTDNNSISILGVASKYRCGACVWEPDLGNLVLDLGIPIVAFAGIGADKPVLEKALGRTVNNVVIDPMVKHYIANPDLASIPKATFNEDDDSAVSLGFMGLWACTSLLHDVPHWKGMRDKHGNAKCSWPSRCLAESLPCPVHNELDYCAIDAWAGLIDNYALDDLLTPQQLNEYYPWRARLCEAGLAMQAKGVRVDQAVIDGLEEAINSKKANLFPFKLSYEGKPFKNGKPRLLKKPRKTWQGPFNPNSPQTVIEYFAGQGIALSSRGKASMGKAVLLTKLEKELKPYGLAFDAVEGTLSGEWDGELPDVLDLLIRLAQKTCTGKGLKSWFDPTYVRNGEVHARFNGLGTGPGRFSSSKPNFQNVPARGFGVEVRKAVVARPGCRILKADFSQLEARICLWMAGSDPSLMDGAFEMLTEKGGDKFLEATKTMGKGATPRDVAKSISHAGNYCEGLQLKADKELSTSGILGDRLSGALEVWDGKERPLWTYKGRFVCFSGINLAERLFRNHTRESRKKALAIQAIYFNEFPQIRAWQMKETQAAETSNIASLPNGHSMKLYGRTGEDNIKFLLALKGQGGGSIYANEALLRFFNQGIVPNLLVHDELVFDDIPADWSAEQCLSFMEPMVQRSSILSGFWAPAKVSWGPNWKETQEIGVLRI